MTGIKPSDHGIVVEHKETGIHYAVSDRNYNEKVHRKVRDLGPGETVRGYAPRRKESLSALSSPSGSPEAAGDQAVGSSDGQQDTQAKGTGHKTEGANTGTQEKEGK
ncbi:hypothetical protein IXEL_13 [Microbacterium phage Ixel]|nr:hypothetical protein IXEL_13 [Microbacterium phage Ixel]